MQSTLPETNIRDEWITKWIITCVEIRASGDGNHIITKGNQYHVREKEDPAALKIVTNTAVLATGTHDRGPSPTCKVRNVGKPVAPVMQYFESGADEVYDPAPQLSTALSADPCRRVGSGIAHIRALYDRCRNQGDS